MVIGWNLSAYMYMSSDLSGEVERKESKTTFKTTFAFFNWYSKIPEVDMISLRLRKVEPAKHTATEAESASNAVADDLPAFRSISTSKSCMSEMLELLPHYLHQYQRVNPKPCQEYGHKLVYNRSIVDTDQRREDSSPNYEYPEISR
jgi:hypothetical protein